VAQQYLFNPFNCKHKLNGFKFMTLWLLWFYGDIWWQMSRETPEGTRKKKRRKLNPQTPNDCELCRLGVHKPRQLCWQPFSSVLKTG
jgi:hypothetical protein